MSLNTEIYKEKGTQEEDDVLVKEFYELFWLKFKKSEKLKILDFVLSY